MTKTFLQEDAQEGSLRPKTLREYIGQEKAKDNLSIFIQAAQKRGEALDHVLLHGPPGLGKTTLAGIIAQEMGVNIRITSGQRLDLSILRLALFPLHGLSSYCKLIAVKRDIDGYVGFWAGWGK